MDDTSSVHDDIECRPTLVFCAAFVASEMNYSSYVANVYVLHCTSSKIFWQMFGQFLKRIVRFTRVYNLISFLQKKKNNVVHTQHQFQTSYINLKSSICLIWRFIALYSKLEINNNLIIARLLYSPPTGADLTHSAKHPRITVIFWINTPERHTSYNDFHST